MGINSKHVIAVVGTTAIGKTALAIKLAKKYNAEIISADSRQFYKEMTIGTAVPSKNELKEATHHFIQNLSIFDNYSVGDFERDAIKKIEELHKKNDVVIMVGGSGLYVNAVLKGLDYFPEVDPDVRLKLKEELDNKGIQSLQKKLEKLDIAAYNTIAVDNPQRLIRALEVSIGTGNPYSSYLNKSKDTRNFKSIKVGLIANRQIIYDRINKRVDLMINEGLIKEAKSLHSYKHLNALQTVGYKELFGFFEGKYPKEFAISEIKKNTRRFAKRQITWFKKDDQIKWFEYDLEFAKISKHLNSILKR
jgi:tRNA dimethylallyltransferase